MICRLCLKEIQAIINIFGEIGIELNVSTILSKYFWFEPKFDDPISTAICTDCWLTVSRFHEFYSSVEESHRLLSERFSYKNITNAERTQRNETTFQKTEELEQQLNLQEKTIHGAHNNKSLPSLVETREDENGASFDGVTCMDKIADVENNVEINFKKSEPLNICQRRSKRTNVNNCAIVDTKPRICKKSQAKLPAFVDVPEQVSDNAIKDNSIQATKHKVDEKISQFLSLRCDICALEHTNFMKLRSHMEKTHNCKGYIICCNKKFFKRILLVEHIEKHLNPDCYKCIDCDKVFADKQCLRNHILLKHKPEEEKLFQCQHCPRKFAKSYLLDQHRVIHDARTHICEVCQKGFPTKMLLFNHVKVTHSNSTGTMCDICAKVVRGRAAFLKHQLEHQGVPIPKVQCDKCGSWHKDKYALQKHKRRHNEEGTLHICSICGKVAPNRSALLSHHRYVHASERIFECSVCTKSFKKAINLKEHMATHTGEVLYHCPHCTRTFISNANMHSHRKKKHPKEFEEGRIKRRNHTQGGS